MEGQPARTPTLTTTPLPQETLRRKRDGLALSAAEITAFVDGITHGAIGEAQMAAFAMAVRLRGMDTAETVALTLAMRDSGERLAWPPAAFDPPGPVVDKHSTGGVGDLVSLVLGPLLAACGCYVPMISGRALGHTGGTLDKLEAIPGYTVLAPAAQWHRVVRQVGVAIVGAGPGLAPADQRLYAVRDVTATVDSLPLITASILAKKLAAGLQALVLDVKFGNGAFLSGLDEARALAHSLVGTARGAGLPSQAVLTDMNQPLAPVAGNALEVGYALDWLACRPPAALPAGAGEAGIAASRFDAVVAALGSRLLVQAGRAVDLPTAQAQLDAARRSGAAAERFARMVAGLGGPADLLEQPARHLAAAAVVRPVPPPAGGAGCVVQMDTRALGLAVIGLGGGRRSPGERIDPSVGLSGLAPLGRRSDPGAPLAWVHAANERAAAEAVAAVQAAYGLGDAPPEPTPVVLPDALPDDFTAGHPA